MGRYHRSLTGAWALVFAVLIGLGGCAGSQTRESTGEFVDDSAITTKVKTAFVKDKEVSALNIKVETFKGVVQLSGFANSPGEAKKAEQIARGIEGVKSVRNDISVK